MIDTRHIETAIYERLSRVIDPELGRSVTDLGMIAAIDAVPCDDTETANGGNDDAMQAYDVTVQVELTVEGARCRRRSRTRSTARSPRTRTPGSRRISKSPR